MEVSSFRVAPLVAERIDQAVENYEAAYDDENADLLEERLVGALDEIAADPMSGKPLLGLPPHYRRTDVPPFYYVHRWNEAKGDVLVFLLRHMEEPTYKAKTIRNKASSAENAAEEW